MRLFTIVVFAMASLFNLGILDARYKIDIKVEGGLKGCNHSSKLAATYDKKSKVLIPKTIDSFYCI